jgi:hypothetical protein
MTSQCSFDSQYFVDHIMVALIEKVFPKRRNPHARRPHLHLDNCRVRFSSVAEQFIAQNHISRVPQPAYSLDLAPSYFWLFGHLKNSLAGRIFDNPEQVLDDITSFLEEVQPSELHVVFSHCVERVRSVLENNGDYSHESIFRGQKYLSVRSQKGWRHNLLTARYLASVSHFELLTSATKSVSDILPDIDAAFSKVQLKSEKKPKT